MTPWTVAHQATLSMGFSRQEYWGGLPFPYLGDLPNPGIEPRYPALQADSLPTESQVRPDMQIVIYIYIINPSDFTYKVMSELHTQSFVIARKVINRIIHIYHFTYLVLNL